MKVIIKSKCVLLIWITDAISLINTQTNHKYAQRVLAGLQDHRQTNYGKFKLLLGHVTWINEIKCFNNVTCLILTSFNSWLYCDCALDIWKGNSVAPKPFFCCTKSK